MGRRNLSLVQSQHFPSLPWMQLITSSSCSGMRTTSLPKKNNQLAQLHWSSIASPSTRLLTPSWVNYPNRFSVCIQPIVDAGHGTIGFMFSTAWKPWMHEAAQEQWYLRITSPKIILFVDLSHSLLPNMTDIEGYRSPGMYALVHMQEKQPVPVEESVLLSTCTLSDSSILSPCHH